MGTGYSDKGTPLTGYALHMHLFTKYVRKVTRDKSYLLHDETLCFKSVAKSKKK